jgi:hypothetical protein
LAARRFMKLDVVHNTAILPSNRQGTCREV